MQKNKVYIHGSYFGNNYGDVLLVDLFASKVRSAGYEPIFPYASDFYFQQTGVNVGVTDQRGILCGIYCGGGYFGEPSKGKLKWSFRNTLRHFRSYKLFNNLPYGIFGSGFGPITYSPFKSLATSIFNNSKTSIVRDRKSQEFVSEYTHGKVKPKILADVVISLTKDDIPTDKFEAAKEKFKNLPNSKKYIGIHLTDKFKDTEAFKKVISAIKLLSDENKDYFFILISDGTSRLGRKLQQDVDAEFIQDAIGKDRSVMYSYENHWDLTAFLSLLDVVVTSKLHVGIVSTAMKTPVISIPYHSKTIRYYEQVGAPERCLNNFTSSNEVLEHLKKYINSPAIDVPDSVIQSSSQVFSEMISFIKSCE